MRVTLLTHPTNDDVHCRHIFGTHRSVRLTKAASVTRHRSVRVRNAWKCRIVQLLVPVCIGMLTIGQLAGQQPRQQVALLSKASQHLFQAPSALSYSNFELI